MEHSYMFGTARLRRQEEEEYLRTKGSTHTDLNGFCTKVTEYQDSVVTDCFLVLEKYKAGEDGEGNCYDWYRIKDHVRLVQKKAEGPTQLDRIEAQTMFTALMTDTLLEEV